MSRKQILSDDDLRALEAELWKSRPRKKWRCSQPIASWWPERVRWLAVIGQMADRGLDLHNTGQRTCTGRLGGGRVS